MSNFEKVIGYETIKSELMQVCDMLQNKEVYQELGAKFPNGVLLYGEPGLGKTLMARCFIDECNLETFTIRKNKSENFVGYITETFKKAKENAPSVIFLDDMDKFANEDNNHKDAEEYVAIQAGIDDIKGCDVFVLATANEIRKLPKSLTRSGRFDRCIEVCSPNSEDCLRIIGHYLSSKKVSVDINIEDISKMISYSSCAELETIMNEAAIIAGYKRKKCIEMSDVVSAVLKMEYNSPDDFTKVSDSELKKIAIHEAGHLIMSDLLCPGSVGLASLRTHGRNSVGGFVRRCKKLPSAKCHILVSLAGKVAVELSYGICAEGCQSDIKRAYECIRDEISENGSMGFGMVDVANHRFPETSESLNCRNEAVVQAEMERYMFKAKEIIAENKEYLEKTANALLEKETLLASDIKKIREETNIIV